MVHFPQLYIVSRGNLLLYYFYLEIEVTIAPLSKVYWEIKCVQKLNFFYVGNPHKRHCLRLLSNRNIMWTIYIFIFSRKDIKTQKKSGEVNCIYSHLTQYNQILSVWHIINIKIIYEIFCILLYMLSLWNLVLCSLYLQNTSNCPHFKCLGTTCSLSDNTGLRKHWLSIVITVCDFFSD